MSFISVACCNLIYVSQLQTQDYNRSQISACSLCRYFFVCLLALLLISTFNALVFFPVLLSLCGPSAEICLNDPQSTSLPPPTPDPTPPPSLLASKRRKMSHHQRAPSDAVLSTISEEPSQLSSQDIVVEPQIKVETTVIPANTSNIKQVSTSLL